jgi:transcriptional regulator with XRE-family HTH domain
MVNQGHKQGGSGMPQTFGQRIKELRKAKGLGQRAVAAQVGINFTYLSKIENDKVDFAAFPSEDTIRKLAKVLEADVDELLLMAEKIPDHIRRRVLEKPDAFRMIASLDDKSLDRLVKGIKLT